ncbi:MAG: hypothetical protein KJZ85_01750 [Rhodobacteraceae bacterium]|nr:hypothetical protein [Paracoccaceae bacterium]
MRAAGGRVRAGLRCGGLVAAVAAMTALAAPAAAEAPVIEQVAAGAYHSCALDESRHVWCWGFNGQGQIGDGTTAARLAPVAVQFPAG